MLLDGDWQRSTVEAGTVMETLLTSDPPLIKEAWRQMKGWYKTDTNRHPSPKFVTL